MGNLLSDSDNNKALEEDEEYKTECITSIVLIGDSVLDNFYWLDDKTMDIKHQLMKTLNNNNISIHNSAVDESQTIHVLKGKKPAIQYINGRKLNNLDPYPMDKNDNKVYPLRLLENHINENKSASNKTLVVLSIGGNDIYVNLGFDDSKQVIMTVKQQDFEDNYRNIVEIVVNKYKCNLILILCYRPNLNNNGSFYNFSRECLINIVEYVANIIFDIGNKYNLPIIDLSRTFDPFNGAHYGSTAIEPSNLSGQFIVDLIIRVKNHFKFKHNESKIYYGFKSSKNGIINVINNNKARKQYLTDIKNQKPKLNLKT